MAAPQDTVLQGDCLAQLKKVPTGSVDLVFADPPFNIGFEYDVYNDERGRHEYLDWSKKWMQAACRTLKPNGTFWLAIGDEYAAELKVLAQDKLGLHCRSWVIWYYTFGVNCVRAFTRSHTHLFHFVKDPEDYTFNADNPAVRVLSARALVYADPRANPKGRLPDNTWILRPQDAPADAFQPLHDTWCYSRVAGTFKEREGFHGCQMPEQLLGRIIRLSSRPGEMVLDPFAGSGTTLAVAKKLGRRWLGCELSRDYVKRIRKRLDEAQPGDRLDGPADPVRSAPPTARGRRNVQVRNGRPVPLGDAETMHDIAAAFRDTSDGHSADFVLCDPELNAEFLAACKQKGLGGGPFVWNRLLLRARKSGQLPKSTRPRPRLTFNDMDAYSAAAEIAYHLLSVDYGMKLDDILCNPEAVVEFDRLAESFAPGHRPLEYRWAALALRKRAKRSRALASEKYSEWLEDNRLPQEIALAKALEKAEAAPAVYVLRHEKGPLYVGETQDLRSRLAALRESECWQALGPTAVRLIPTDDPGEHHGLQAALVHRLRPRLNSTLLRPRQIAGKRNGKPAAV